MNNHQGKTDLKNNTTDKLWVQTHFFPYKPFTETGFFFLLSKLNIFVLNLIFRLFSSFISNTHSLLPLTPHVKQHWVISSSPVSHITLKSFSFTSDSTARTEAFCFVKVCRDVNECEGLNNGGCVENSICMNTPVSKSSKLDLKKTSACKCKSPTDIYRDQIKWTQMVWNKTRC